MTFSFHARVDDDGISKVSRLFNASVDDVLNELLQNARRSGATTVHITESETPEFGASICVADNGPGIDSPEILFKLGRSAWSRDVAQSEDAAGMGFFALANRGARVIAQKRGTDTSWVLQASPEAFSGEACIVGEVGPSHHRGMAVTFPVRNMDFVSEAVKKAARYCPLDITFNGEAMERVDFLADAKHIEEWRGIRIGVYHRRPLVHSSFYHNANFHGVTLHVPLPTLQQEFHHSFEVLIDVAHCVDLKLVLPARKEVVENEFLHQLQARIHKIYFQLVKNAGQHSLSFRDYSRGLELGVELPEAVKQLRLFVPDQANHDQNYRSDPVTVACNGFLYIDSEGPVEEQNVARAINQSIEPERVYEPVPAFIGYEWYDEFPRIRLKGYGAVLEGKWMEVTTEDRFEFTNRPDRLAILLEVSERHKHLCLETDVVVLAEDYVSLDEADVHVVASCEITPVALVDFLEAALFSPSDDSEAGSYDQQRQWFTDEAEDLAYTMLQSTTAANTNLIKRVVQRELFWRFPSGQDYTIQIRDRKITVLGLNDGSEQAVTP